MDIFGIGPMEIALILILVIIIFGPKDLMKTGKTIGKSLNKFVRSDTWRTLNQTTQELKNLPTRLMRETGLDDLEQTTRGAIAPTDNMTLPAADLPAVVIRTSETSPRPYPLTPPPSGPVQVPQPTPVRPPDKDAPA
jgi:Sec-independent protein translocase protein TatA